MQLDNAISEQRHISKMLIDHLDEIAALVKEKCSISTMVPIVTDDALIDPVDTEELAAIKVSWKVKQVQFTEDQLEHMFSKYGNIEMVGINQKRNR